MGSSATKFSLPYSEATQLVLGSTVPTMPREICELIQSYTSGFSAFHFGLIRQLRVEGHINKFMGSATYGTNAVETATVLTSNEATTQWIVLTTKDRKLAVWNLQTGVPLSWTSSENMPTLDQKSAHFPSVTGLPWPAGVLRNRGECLFVVPNNLYLCLYLYLSLSLSLLLSLLINLLSRM